MSDKNHACGNCRFFREQPAGNKQCRKDPPLGMAAFVPFPDALGNAKMSTPTFGYWPSVRLDQWCGAWEMNPDLQLTADSVLQPQEN